MKKLATHLKSIHVGLYNERNGLSDLYFSDIPILDRIMNIGRARRQYAKLLKYIALNFDADQSFPFFLWVL